MSHWSHPSEASECCPWEHCRYVLMQYLVLIWLVFLSVMTEVFGGFCLRRQIPCYYREVKCYLISNLTYWPCMIILSYLIVLREFSVLQNVQTYSRVHPAAIQWVPGVCISEVNWPGHEADHSPPSSPEVKILWSSTFPLVFALMVCCLIMHTDNFMFASAMYISRYVDMKLCVCVCVCVIMLEQLQNVMWHG